VLVRDEKQLISTRLANSSRAAPQKKLHHDQLNRSTGLSTVHAADASIATLTPANLNGVTNRSNGNFPA
jgi:hypothetical protein